ncbi:putative gustatory receptor 39b [Lucilia cuprina]|uniref:putative gustatory receptor 39b n=1 Tax=Lucilia cuprina TaxID=7375 RepID=UPI001F0699FE|nr:putative gustatory receptor 39b [Lucilia cuprina]
MHYVTYKVLVYSKQPLDADVISYLLYNTNNMVNELQTKFLKYLAIFGLVPYINSSKHHYHHIHHYNRPLRWQQIYTVTLIVANLMATLYGVIFFPFKDNLIVSNLVSIMVFCVQILVVISILLETMFTYGKYYELINNYNRVQNLMKYLLHIQLNSAEIRQRQRRKYIFLISTVHGSLVVSITVIAVKTYNGYFWYALMAIIILRTRIIQMIYFIDYIVYYMELFNMKLRALISCKIDKNYLLLDIDYDHLESFEYLQILKNIYQELYALHDRFNDLYGHSLASIYTVVVLDIIINMYWTFLTVFEYYESYYNYITCSTLVPLYVILFVMCYTAEQCEIQVGKGTYLTTAIDYIVGYNLVVYSKL